MVSTKVTLTVETGGLAASEADDRNIDSSDKASDTTDDTAEVNPGHKVVASIEFAASEISDNKTDAWETSDAVFEASPEGSALATCVIKDKAAEAWEGKTWRRFLASVIEEAGLNFRARRAS